MRRELKVSDKNFIYNPLEDPPITFIYLLQDDLSNVYNYNGPIEVKVTTVSDLGGYWYFDDCAGTVYTVKLPRDIYELVKAEGSPYKRTKCGFLTTDYKSYHLAPNFFDWTDDLDVDADNFDLKIDLKKLEEKYYERLIGNLWTKVRRLLST